MTDWIAQLCTHLGVQAQYCGYEGQLINVSRDTQLEVLRALELDIGSEADAKAHFLEMQSDDALRPAPPEVIVVAGTACKVPLIHAATWTLEAEAGGAALASGKSAHFLSIPALPLGIHRLRLWTDTREFTSWVLARPTRAIRLQDHIPKSRIWGVQAALYGLTDGDTAQIGNYGLLGDYAAAMAGHGADFVGINPVHAMGQVRPDDVISPYSPSHRGFLNTWYCAWAAHHSGGSSTLIDYSEALKANALLLDEQYAAFSRLPDDASEKCAFRSFAENAGTQLHQFAVFETLSVEFGPDWRDWPAPYCNRNADALADFKAAHADKIARSKWAQWQAEMQLAEAQTKARTAGMRLGLYLDLAVGPRLGGAETWAKDTSLITKATLGAPPDALAPGGQSWGLAPQSPLKCRAEGYAGFARLLRQNMRHAGMIRIDHVLGLMRSFWIPEGATEGTYVSYPFEALLAVVAIESVRNNTIVVGEDLGLVPDGFREKLASTGIYGLDVLQYMRTQTGGFVDTGETRAMAVCAFATHDTPTVAGFFAADDARIRHETGDIGADTLRQTRADRQRAQETLETSDPVSEIHRQLAQSNAGMVAIQLDDVAARTSQQNLPGTVDTYPNWRLKAPFTVSEIVASDAFAELAQDMFSQGRSNLKRMEKEDGLQDCSDHAH